MVGTAKRLLGKLWLDDCGAVIATEYLTLGTVVALGGVSGLVSMRDSVNNEMSEYGASVREMRQSYSAPGYRAGGAYKAGSGAVDSQGAGGSAAGGSGSCFAMP